MPKQNLPFSLPTGIYLSNCQLSKANKYDFEFTKLKFYPPEKKGKKVKIKKIIFATNPHKASVIIDKGIIIIDKDFFKNLNEIQKKFILLHELGHFFYFTEHKCDSFATAMLLKQGYNPSQIHSALSSTLLDSYRKRVNKYLLKKKI